MARLYTTDNLTPAFCRVPTALLALLVLSASESGVLAQAVMPLGTRQWIELSANEIAEGLCCDSVGFVAAMPSPSPNYLTQASSLAAGRSLFANGNSTAQSIMSRIDGVTAFLRNSLFDTYTISGPPGSNGQPVVASLTMHSIGTLRIPQGIPCCLVIGLSSITLEVGTWNIAPLTEQFRVEPFGGLSRFRSIQAFTQLGTIPLSLAINETFIAPFTRTVGVPFDIAYGHDLTGVGGDIASTIAWALPSGYTITSVLGYESNNGGGPVGCSLADLVGGDGNPPADNSLDGNDFQAFLNAFAAGDTLGDLVGGDGNPPADGSVDGNDFQAFLNAFGAGC